MQDKFDDKMNKRLKRTVRITWFCSFFFHMFFPLCALGVIFLIAGIFMHVFAVVGGIILLLDAVLSFLLMLRTLKMHSKHPEFEKFRQAMEGADPYGDLENLTDEWGGDGFYEARVNEIKEEASSCKTVREVYEVYKKHCLAITTRTEDFVVTISKETYFEDRQKHFVISFGREREINDDIICHLYMDILYDPDADIKGKGELRRSVFTSNEKFFNAVEAHLEENDLMDLPAANINIGTDE